MRPRVLSISLIANQACALDYGWKRLVACGSCSTIILLDPTFARCVQSLQGHRNIVCAVSWAPENYHYDYKDHSHVLRLASADVDGDIIIWDVVNASVISEFREGGSNVSDLQWLQNQHVSRDFLLALHSENTCILWNTQTQTQLWRVSLPAKTTSLSMSPYNVKQLLLQTPGYVSIVQEFSLSHPFKMDAAPLTSKSSKSTPSSLSSPKGTLHFPINELDSESGSPAKSDCIQAYFHGYRNDCIVILRRRELVVVNLIIHKPVTSILIGRSVSSFSAAYSCTQRDVLICLHENGALSIYARQGLAQPHETTSSPPSRKLNACEEPYELIAFSEGSRRARRPVRLSVDRARELALTVTSPDGRMQFWQLRCMPLQSVEVSQGAVDPPWCLSDLIPHEVGLVDPPKLYLQMTSVYTSSKPDPTVCRVCPQHFLDIIAVHMDCRALVAVGNSRGGVQIWDMESGSLWREYQILPVPILGIEWFLYDTSQSATQTPRSDSSNDLNFDWNNRQLHQLGLLVHGFQPKDKLSLSDQLLAPPSTEFVVEGKNFLVLVNLWTGYAYSLRESSITSDKIVGGFDVWTVCNGGSRSTPSTSASRSTNSRTDPEFESPIDLTRVSHLGQYLAILIRNNYLELWDLLRFTFLKRIPFNTIGCIVAFDWCQSGSKQVSSAITHQAFQPQSQPQHRWPIPHKGSFNTSSYQRESLISCSSQGTLCLVIVDGSHIDSTAVSNTILDPLTFASMERLSAVAWFADLIAFGTTDGYVAVRDLDCKKTFVRATSSGGWVPMDNQSNSADQTPHPSLSALVGSGRFSTGVRRLCFLPGSFTSFRLLVLLFDSVYIFQPHGMVLSCMARLSGHMQRCLISADWAQPSPNSMDPPMCILIGGDGAVRLLQAGESSIEMTSLETSTGHSSASSTSASDQTITRFFGSSSIPDRIEGRNPLLIPSILPNQTALTIRHLLQHQPWNVKHKSLSSDIETGGVNDPSVDHSSLFELACPALAHGFAKLQLSADAFLKSLSDRNDIRKKFVRPDATIVERCLWTAQLFSDAYETRFWHVAAHRLLGDSTSTKPYVKTRYSLSESWGLLSETSVYRRNIMKGIKLLEQHRDESTRENCIHQLLLLGNHDRAISLLLESPPDSPTYAANMYRACLLATKSSSQNPINATPKLTQAQLIEDTYLSTVKLVATNLLSNGEVKMGIELLCLINLYPDACRYLESFELREQSVSLAKCKLEPAEANKVLHRWASHLSSPEVNRKDWYSTASYKDYAVLIYVLLGEHNKALMLLHSLNQHQLAARYLEACLQLHVLKWSDEPDELYRTIFLEFCNILINLGHRESAHYYCMLAGHLGEEKKQELDIMFC